MRARYPARVPSATITIDGIEMDLMPERALFLRAARALVVADLHVFDRDSAEPVGIVADRSGQKAAQGSMSPVLAGPPVAEAP